MPSGYGGRAFGGHDADTASWFQPLKLVSARCYWKCPQNFIAQMNPMNSMMLTFFLFVPLAALTAAQGASSSYNLSSVLSSQEQLSNFTSLLTTQFPTLFSQLEAGNVTILAPSDQAFAKYLSSKNNASNDTDKLEALLSYHVLQGTHPELLLKKPPQFIPTLLSNPIYTNVTGGQRVEATESDGNVIFYSAVKAISNLVSPDILYSGGTLHIVDTVLTPPIDVLETVIEAKLSGLTALLAGTTPNPDLVGTIATASDLTFFVPNNNSLVLNNFSTQDLLAYEGYSCVQGVVAYSSDLANGKTLKTLQGGGVTITVQNGSIYINAAKVIDPDYLTSSGVLHVLDKGLDPNNTAGPPSPTSAAPSSTSVKTSNPATTISPTAQSASESGLNTSAKAGIGVGVTVGVLAIIGLAWYFMRTRKRSAVHLTGDVKTAETYGPSELSQGDKSLATELEGGGRVYEIGDGR